MMSERDKRLLQVNRENLLKNIFDVDSVASHLLADEVITDSMHDEIVSHRTKASKIRELLTIIPRRGEDAFNQFYEALVKTDEGAAADLLKPELKEMRKKGKIPLASHTVVDEEHDGLPTDWPDESEDFKGNIVVKKTEDGTSMHKKFKMILVQPINNSLPIYSMKNKPRGFCVVINNEDFTDSKIKMEDRTGSEKDYNACLQLFTELNFEVKTFGNKTAFQLEEIAQAYSRKDHLNYECFVMIVMSHGSKGNIYGVDGEEVEIERLTNCFNKVNCPSLKGKPKLFFIQACQDVKQENITQTVITEEEISISKKMDKLRISKDASDGDGEAASMTDFVIAMATMPGYVSWRRIDIGTWFIQAIVYIFKNYSHQRDINGLMTYVNNLVQKAGGGDRQCSVFRSSLSKDFYFFPGLDETQFRSQPLNQMLMEPN
ncbi:caspase-3 [Patella vulgata]|uniref:caspase-3 n=1 Tax=Patella vulgata TaxID=6465 RepID=UPI0024A877A5|nr:caspase-3 [Patella vulgata]XP_050413886.2 caspase-3 [Patella vulgata]XP_050413887.2 caspase-3 [Patella vulgata]